MADGSKREMRAERTRSALLGAGLRLYSERAPGSVTVDDIVNAAGVGKGTFYKYFTDREDLLRALSASTRERINAEIERANVGVEDPAKRLARAVCVYARHAVDEPEAARVLLRLHGGIDALDAPTNRDLLEDLGAGLRSSRFRCADLEAAVVYVLGVAQGALMRIARPDGAPLAASLMREVGELMLRGLGLPSADAATIAAEAATALLG